MPRNLPRKPTDADHCDDHCQNSSCKKGAPVELDLRMG